MHVLRKRWELLLIGLMLLPYFFGYLYPEIWWATHFLAFVPSWIALGILIIAVGLVFIDFVKPDLTKKLAYPLSKWRHKVLPYTLIGILAAVLIYQFPITKDYYGDAKRFIHIGNQQVNELPDLVNQFFNYSLQPGESRTMSIGIVEVLAYHTRLTFKQAFTMLNAALGGLFILVWLTTVSKHIKSSTLRLVFSLMGMTTPMFLVYFGHLESYAIVFTLVLIFSVLLLQNLKKGTKVTLWVALLILVFTTRFHPLTVFLYPAWILAFLRQYLGRTNLIRRLLTLKGAIQFIFIPITMVGAVVYFFVLQQHRNPMVLKGDFSELSRLFLPLYSPNPPLDNYTLLSWNHISDFLMITLWWSPVLVSLSIVIVVRITTARLKLDSSSVILFLPFLLLVSFLFMVNPLYSFPLDWDLMCFPVILLMVLLVSVVSDIPNFHYVEKMPIGGLIGLSLMFIPIVMTMANNRSHSYRMEAVAERVYHTYYQHAGSLFLYSFGMIEKDMELYLKRSDAAIERIRPFARVGIDEVFSDLLTDNGLFRLRISNDLDGAQLRFTEANRYSDHNDDNLIYLMESYYGMGQYKAATETALVLLDKKYPSNNLSTRMVVHCALADANYDLAKNTARVYLNAGGQDPLLRKVLERIETGDHVERLIYLFDNG